MYPFRFTTELEIRFRDLDALGHVNNAVYLTYFEIVRTRYWKHLFGLPPAHDWGFVMVRTECNYRSPALLGETIAMGRMGQPDDVADVCLFLASPMARWMSGANIKVHGGGEKPAYLGVSTGEVTSEES